MPNLRRDDKIEQLASRALQRRALRHLLSAIQRYLRQQQLRREAAAIYHRGLMTRTLHAWHGSVVLLCRVRRLADRRGQRQLRLAMQVLTYAPHRLPSWMAPCTGLCTAGARRGHPCIHSRPSAQAMSDTAARHVRLPHGSQSCRHGGSTRAAAASRRCQSPLWALLW